MTGKVIVATGASSSIVHHFVDSLSHTSACPVFVIVVLSKAKGERTVHLVVALWLLRGDSTDAEIMIACCGVVVQAQALAP